MEKQRLEVVQFYIQKESSMTELCNKFGISRKTGYKWLQRFLEHGEGGLHDLSRAPHTPNYYSEEQIKIAIDLKRRKRTWGPKKSHQN